MWINVTEDDVKTRISGPELEAFRKAALASGQDDPVQEIISQNVELVRGYIAACDNNSLGADDTIPRKLLGSCLSLVVMDIMARAAGKIIDPSGARKDAAGKATSLLKDVARCAFAVEQPQEVSAEVIGVKPTFKGRTAMFGRENSAGI